MTDEFLSDQDFWHVVWIAVLVIAVLVLIFSLGYWLGYDFSAADQALIVPVCFPGRAGFPELPPLMNSSLTIGGS